MEQDRDKSAKRGIGPGGSSLAEKLGRPGGLTFTDPFAMQLEQQERREQRISATIAWAERNRTPPKPVAPVEQTDQKGEDGTRLWRWTGKTILSKNLHQGGLATGEWIRKAGFKLPVLVKTKAPRKPRAKRKGASDERVTEE